MLNFDTRSKIWLPQKMKRKLIGKQKKIQIPTLRNHDPLEWKVLHFSACPVVENIWEEYLHKNTF